MSKIKEQLNRAVDSLPRPDAAKLWETPVPRMEEHDYITWQETGGRRNASPVRRLAASMACLVMVCLAGLGWYAQNGMIDAVVGLEINPAFEITLNRRQNVLSVKGLNAEATDILANRDYHGWAIEDTVETLMRSVEGAYLQTGAENTVLISVRSADGEKADALGDRLSRRVRETVDRPERPTTVLHQSSTVQDEADASAYGISAGRLRLIRTLAEQSSQHSLEELARFSLEELERLILQTGGTMGVRVVRSAWAIGLSDDRDDGDDLDVDDFDDHVPPVITRPQPAPVQTPASPPPTPRDDDDDDTDDDNDDDDVDRDDDDDDDDSDDDDD